MNKIIRWQFCWKTKFNIVAVLHHKISILTYESPLDTYSLQLYEILYKKVVIGEWIIDLKTKCSTVAAAVLNLFLIASLNMPSPGHSLSSKHQILCNISILNWVVGTWWDSRWRACWIVENLNIEPYVVIGCLLSITISNILINVQILDHNRNSRLKPSAISDFRKGDSWTMGRLRQLIFRLGTKFGA